MQFLDFCKMPSLNFNIIIVDSLPDVSLADSKSIYLVPKTDTQTGNIYFEYICVTEVNPLYQSETKYWEEIGDIEIDLEI